MFTQLYDGIDESLLSLTFNQMLPKLYGVSMMWTLNERRHIRSGGLRDDSDSFSLPDFRITVRLFPIHQVLLRLTGASYAE